MFQTGNFGVLHAGTHRRPGYVPFFYFGGGFLLMFVPKLLPPSEKD